MLPRSTATFASLRFNGDGSCPQRKRCITSSLDQPGSSRRTNAGFMVRSVRLTAYTTADLARATCHADGLSMGQYPTSQTTVVDATANQHLRSHCVLH